MLREGLSPGVQDGGDADRPAKMRGIATEREQGVGGGPKQQRIQHARIALGQGVEGMRQGEDEVEVRNREHLSPAGLEPPFFCDGLALRAMAIAARVVRDPHGATPVTRLPMTAEGGGATGLDRVERPSENRTAPMDQSSDTPMATSTCEGSTWPDLQAEPAETATPLRSRPSTMDSDST